MLMVSLPRSPPFPELKASPNNSTIQHAGCQAERKTEDLREEAKTLLSHQSDVDSTLSMSKKLHADFQARLQTSPCCMLPSHTYTLPTGEEEGAYLALDVGGSILRIALVFLERGCDAENRVQIRRIESLVIDEKTRALPGVSFFDWIADSIHRMLAQEDHILVNLPKSEALRMGVAWSFPIEQTSVRSGRILSMGKGFRCSETVLGRDLGEVLTQACRRANLNVRLDALVNDSAATLLSRACVDVNTRLALIFGTGMNAAVHLPITALNESKFSQPPSLPHTQPTHVLVNTELSMFGKDVFPHTRWDDQLNANHILPDYQPFEYLIAGPYMGEIIRLILVEAAHTCSLFSGILPPSLLRPYSIDARTIAAIEFDNSPSLSHSCNLFQELYPSSTPPSYIDLYFLQSIIQSITHRASTYLATGIHALWSLRNHAEGIDPSIDLTPVSIGCDGSVINRYSGFMERCQAHLDDLTRSEGFGTGRIVLEKALGTAVLGAGVAAALSVREEQSGYV